MITLAATLLILIGVACAAIAFFAGMLLLLQWRDEAHRRSNRTDGLAV